jgi:hypothetical protein
VLLTKWPNVVEQGHDLDAAHVQQGMDQQGDAEQQHRVAGSRGETELQVQEGVQELGEAEVDARGDGDLAEEVEPAGEPGPRRAVVLGQLRRPVVEAARGRIAGAHLRHAEADGESEQADDRPAPHHDGRAAGVHAEAVQGHAAGEDADDREGDREVRERRHAALEFLRVAELVQPGLVVAHAG